MHNSKICADCGIELRPHVNGIVAVEMSVSGPIAIWEADLWHCTNCNKQLLLGFAQSPEVVQPGDIENYLIAVYNARKKAIIPFWTNMKEKILFKYKSLLDYLDEYALRIVKNVN